MRFITNENNDLSVTTNESDNRQSTIEKHFNNILNDYEEILNIDQDCLMIINGILSYKLIKIEGKVSFEYKSNLGWIINYKISNKGNFLIFLRNSFI